MRTRPACAATSTWSGARPASSPSGPPSAWMSRPSRASRPTATCVSARLTSGPRARGRRRLTPSGHLCGAPWSSRATNWQACSSCGVPSEYLAGCRCAGHERGGAVRISWAAGRLARAPPATFAVARARAPSSVYRPARGSPGAHRAVAPPSPVEGPPCPSRGRCPWRTGTTPCAVVVFFNRHLRLPSGSQDDPDPAHMTPRWPPTWCSAGACRQRVFDGIIVLLSGSAVDSVVYARGSATLLSF
mmetsp:Transcript_47639/g.146820  ORF Transcript_47639/g.146820 Transcript_47639/m.146820 type:complete len:245 (+) Transcript_47639:698-1432(+)